MISDGAAEAIKEDDAMSVFFMDFDMAPSVIWARDLYDQMQIRSDFRKWFPRMCQYGFVEGRDYEFVPRVRPQDEGGRTVQRYVKDYRITLEMAKQLYKLHHFHKNDCFRSCEGQHCMGTDHWMQAVIELLHQHKCKSHAPPKRFYKSTAAVQRCSIVCSICTVSSTGPITSGCCMQSIRIRDILQTLFSGSIGVMAVQWKSCTRHGRTKAGSFCTTN